MSIVFSSCSRQQPSESGRIRWSLVLILVPIFLLAGWWLKDSLTRVQPREPKRKVVVLGFDGVDPRLCREFMDKGALPNLSRLSRQGTFRELGTVNPSQSPVSWSSFAVGGDPGQHGIFDFLTRTGGDPTYLPSPESFVGQIEARFFGGIPVRLPKAINKRGGRAFWDYAAESGIRTALVLVPVTFAPPCLPNGLAISGLGVPDLCGTQATYFYLTSNPRKVGVAQMTEFGGLVTLLKRSGDSYHAQLVGPPSPLWKQEKSRKSDGLKKQKDSIKSPGLLLDEKQKIQSEIDRLQNDLSAFTAHPQRLSMPIEVVPLSEPGTARITIDQDEKVVAVGKWSEWYRVRFKVTRFISAHGICKVLLQSVTPDVRLYVSPIEIDPERPAVPICCPPNYTRQLAQKIGLFKTRGWESDTAGLKEGALDEKAFIEDTFEVMDKHAEMALEVLHEDDWGLYVAVLSETDRVSHVMWRLIDPRHPAYDPVLAAEYGDSIEKVYRKMDDLVGKFLNEINPLTTDLYIISDHGFRSFHTGVNLNTWLSQNGPGGDASRPFMKLRLPANRQYNLQDLFSGNTDFFKASIHDPVEGTTKTEYYVNWNETRAFALGLGSIFINLRGRETWGCVARADYNAVCDEIIQGLESLVDPATGKRVIRKVYRGLEIYHGPYANIDSVAFPDLVVGFEEGYRVGWQSTLGGITDQVLVPNRDKWSGDHCGIDPSLTSGILFANRPVEASRTEIIDIAPTILDSLGVPYPTLQGRSFAREGTANP